MAITRRSNVGFSDSGITADGNNATINKSSDAVDGDLMFALVAVGDHAADLTVTPSEGWASVLALPNPAGTGSAGLFVFAKVASSEPASYSFVLGGAAIPSDWTSLCAAYVGSGLTYYIGSTLADEVGPTLVSDSITSLRVNDVVLSTYGQDQTVSDGSYAASSPGALALVSQRWSEALGSNIGLALFEEVRAAPGSGAHTVTQNTGGDNTRGAPTAIWALTESPPSPADAPSFALLGRGAGW